MNARHLSITAVLMTFFSLASCDVVKDEVSDDSQASTSGPTIYWFSGLMADSSGDLLVADNITNCFMKRTSDGAISTIAGSGTSGDINGTGTAASFDFYVGDIVGIAQDSTGTIYVADQGNHKIKKITPEGVVTTFAGSGTAGATNGTGTAASFNYPEGIALTSSGILYVADRGNNKIRKITAAGVVTTLAGSGSQGSANGTGTAASFWWPSGLVLDAAGNLYVTDYVKDNIRKITAAGVVTTFAGSGTAGSTNGTGTAASFNQPCGIARDSSGNFYVTDYGNNLIRKITAAAKVTTFAGSGVAGHTDGTGTSASFYHPTTITVDQSDNLYVGDYFGNSLRKISPAGVVTTVMD